MDKLTFYDELGDREFAILNSTEPIVMYKEHFFPLYVIFPTVKLINWEMGYMVDKGRILAAQEASEHIKRMDWFPEYYVLSKLN